MKFEQLIHCTVELPWFDLPFLAQLSGESKRQLITQLYRWITAGRVLALRRGLYALADIYRKAPLSPLRLANEMYKPSYLSGAWALSYYDLIPEKAVTYTSVTTRVTRSFQNKLGTYAYSSLKKEFFFGFVFTQIDGGVWIAEPEKALLDYWHLMRGEWTKERLMEMRFQNEEQLNWDKLEHYVDKWESPRLKMVLGRFKKIFETNTEGYSTL